MRSDFSHFLPLWVFTSLTLVAVGCCLAVGIATFLMYEWPLEVPLLLFGLMCVVGGGLTSFRHLGKPERGHRALFGLGNSWLSREALLTGLFTAAIMAALAQTPGTLYDVVAMVVLSLIGAATAIAIGCLYNLTAQPGWLGPGIVMHPLVAAGLLTVYLLKGLLQHLFLPIVALVWIADALFVLIKQRGYARLDRQRMPFQFSHKARLLPLLIIVRLILSAVALFFALFVHAIFAALTMALAIGLDRWILYSGTAPVRPAHEIAALKAQRMHAAVVAHNEHTIH